MLKQRFMRFIRGRYVATAGIDGFSWFLVVCYFVLSVLAGFCGGILRSAVAMLSTFSLIYMFFRLFSKNIYARQQENRKFMGIWRKVKGFFKLQGDRFKDRKTHVYKRCKKCKAVIRLPKKKGKHSVVCPGCGNRFDVNNVF